jgi:formylmethanofuran dehydrogenase subunit E
MLRCSRATHGHDHPPRQPVGFACGVDDDLRLHGSAQATPLVRTRESFAVKSLNEYLELSAQAHGHLCAGQVLGVRLAMLGLRELGIDDPIADKKRLMTYVEIDRCVTDAVAVVANCRLGKRALKFRDWGKVAATFVDLKTGRAIRVAAKESSKQAAREMFPELDKEAGQQKAYAQLPDEVLFDKQWVRVEVLPEDLPGFKGPRVVCAQCGEGINFKREIVVNGRTLCRSCAGESYYEAE